ncbi:AAC(3) family N-acetyltransferase [Natronorarus salvus]|uniref:AAC(3) family N-acetyltransferase n=1 Tax=Natronorarus salvus TaxID=3117733 RepID=UPI002F2610CA
MGTPVEEIETAGKSVRRGARRARDVALAHAPERVHRGRILANRLAMYARNRRTDRSVDRSDPKRFDAILDEYSADTVFVHVGLRDVKSAFDRNPYEFLLSRLDDRFESVLTQGFTPAFRSPDGIYHKQFSLPRFGAFARLFFEDCDYRTEDPTNSLLVRGPYRFDDCTHRDTWSRAGAFGKLNRENVLYLDIGTDWLRASQIHYIESILGVPYMRTVEYDGVVYTDETTYERVTHRSHAYDDEVRWNRPKLEAGLREAGVLDSYDLSGLRIRAFRARELREWLAPRIERDPYYVVT